MIKNSIKDNKSSKFFDENYNFSLGENNFFLL